MSSCRKVRYRTRLAAKLALMRIRAHSSRQEQEKVERRIYWCQKCRALHLTSLP